MKTDFEQCINLNELIFKHKWDYNKLTNKCGICGNECPPYFVAVHPTEEQPKGGYYKIPGAAYCHITQSNEKIVTEFCSPQCSLKWYEQI